MTKIIPVVLTEYQNQIFNASDRVSLVTGSFGVGNTYGLLLKAIKEAVDGKLVTYILNYDGHVTKAGGVFQEASKLACTWGGRVSELSRILSFPSGGKVKFVGGENSLEYSKNVSSDLVILEHVKKEDVVSYHLMRSKQVIIREAFYELLESTPDHYLQKFGLVETNENGQAIKVADWVNHITCSHENGYKWENWESYNKIFLENKSYDMQKLRLYKF